MLKASTDVKLLPVIMFHGINLQIKFSSVHFCAGTNLQTQTCPRSTDSCRVFIAVTQNSVIDHNSHNKDKDEHHILRRDVTDENDSASKAFRPPPPPPPFFSFLKNHLECFLTRWLPFRYQHSEGVGTLPPLMSGHVPTSGGSLNVNTPRPHLKARPTDGTREPGCIIHGHE